MDSRASGDSVFFELLYHLDPDFPAECDGSPLFIGAFVVSVGAFEFSRRGLPKGLRFAYLITLGLGAALLVAPWLVDLIYS